MDSVPATPPISLLIIDDHTSVRVGLRKMLEQVPFIKSIDDSNDGAAAIQLLYNSQVDVILMDIRMPHLNGILATQSIKKLFPEIKIIALSMHSELRYIKQMIQNGASGYLLKDDEREEIIEAIVAVANSGTYLSRKIRQLYPDKDLLKEIRETSKKTKHEDDLHAIFFLLCYGKSSKQIADIMCFSSRTIEQYRRQLHEFYEKDSLASLIGFGIGQGILDDETLKNRFAKFIK
ncbi:MAG: hypothetical protein RL641_428 [Candidatus Parcubacteria bacterium]|jgi:DNA-binding NarL/FixJ family response regulator